ncbi:MAG: GSCFA domain-containing protein [Prevotellaceae bacterium]|nr:GSCFA domain-containing protein [Prevotellaceae bacterium]
MPPENFVHECLSVDDIVKQYADFVDDVTKSLPEIRILFSISPVRHLKNGAYDNHKRLFFAILRPLHSSVPLLCGEGCRIEAEKQLFRVCFVVFNHFGNNRR